MRLLRERPSWAQELGCDRAVLDGRSPAQRKADAAALVSQLTLQRHPASTALAVGGVSADPEAARIAQIRAPGAAAGPWSRLAVAGALAGIVACSLASSPRLPRTATRLWQPGNQGWNAPSCSMQTAASACCTRASATNG